MISVNNKPILKKAVRVRSPFAQAFGLMWKKTLVDEGWVFEFTRTSTWHITNLFVFQTIDVVWLDVDKKVLQVRTIKPHTLHCAGVRGTKTVIEMPKGTASKAKIQLADTFSWTFSVPPKKAKGI